MPQTEYLLTEVNFDTSKNEPSKFWGAMRKSAVLAAEALSRGAARHRRRGRPGDLGRPELCKYIEGRKLSYKMIRKVSNLLLKQEAWLTSLGYRYVGMVNAGSEASAALHSLRLSKNDYEQY